MSAGYERILVETRGKLRVIRFNQPKKKNALDAVAYREITRALLEANRCPSITTVALTGTGDYYSSGNDITAAFKRAMDNEDPETAIKTSNQTIYDLVDAFISFEKLLIAVVNGPCIGIAFTTAVLCDVVYATKSVSIESQC